MLVIVPGLVFQDRIFYSSNFRSLEYLGYPSSNIGNKVTITAATTSAEDARRDFAQQTGDGTKIYASFLASLQSAPSNSSYFASLYSTATTGGGY